MFFPVHIYLFMSVFTECLTGAKYCSKYVKVLSSIIFTIALYGRGDHYPHFTNDKTSTLPKAT